MPIDNIRKRKIGEQLTDWVVLGIRTGARQLVEQYRTTKPTNPILAKQYLEAAISKPRRARARINDWIADYDSKNGAGTAVTFLGECLALRGIATLAEINAELTLLEAQAQTLINNNAGGWTLDQVAAAIENNMEWEAKQWTFPNLTAFVDTQLVDN